MLAEIIAEHLGPLPSAEPRPADSLANALETAHKMLAALWLRRPKFV
jgi:hypothetical protein